MRDGLDGARALLPGVRLAHLDTLGGGDRSTVRRVAADSGTLIVKEFTESGAGGTGWVRESAALSVLPPAAPAPRLLAAGHAPPIVVMSDAGRGTSVADALLGDDPAAAADAVVSWAGAIARLHRATAGARDAFRTALSDRAALSHRASLSDRATLSDQGTLSDRATLNHRASLSDQGTLSDRAAAVRGPASQQPATERPAAREPATPPQETARPAVAESTVAESTVAADLDETARRIARYCAELDVRVPAGALDELRGLAARLDGDGPAALTPDDACPDNNVRLGDSLVLIDFEGAQWRHIAWDVAYLVVPWPSCWCSWRVPAGVTERAIDAYRAELGTPYVRSGGFRDDVDTAAAGWAFISMCWFLPRALADDPPFAGGAGTGGEAAAPARSAVILHRLDAARRAAGLPALAELADRMHAVLTRRWGGSPLAYAPAFRG